MANQASSPPKTSVGRKIFGIFTIVFGLLFLIAAIGMVVVFSARDKSTQCARAETETRAAQQAKKDYESAKGTPNEAVAEEKARTRDADAWSATSLCDVVKSRVMREWFVVTVSAILGLILIVAGGLIVRKARAAV